MVSKLDEYLTEWEKDSEMDETEPGRELLRIPKLHAKWHRALSMYTLLSVQTNIEISERKKFLFEYYLGKLTKEDLKKLDIEPWNHTTVRADLPVYMDSDKTLNALILKKSGYDAIISLVNNILKELGQRTWQLKSYIDYEKMLNGN